MNESPEDEDSNIHIGTFGQVRIDYSDLGLGNDAPGVGPNGMVDFYNVYGPDRLKLSDCQYTNG